MKLIELYIDQAQLDNDFATPRLCWLIFISKESWFKEIDWLPYTSLTRT